MGLAADYLEADQFSAAPSSILNQYTPFGRVPVLRNGSFTLTENVAIIGYLNDQSANPVPRPASAEGVAQMAPMIAYFTQVPEAENLLHKYPALSAWWDLLRNRPSLIATNRFQHGNCVLG